MNKTEIKNQFNLLINALEDNDAKEHLIKFKNNVTWHIEKLEIEINVQQDIIDQQVKLIMEKGK